MIFQLQGLNARLTRNVLITLHASRRNALIPARHSHAELMHNVLSRGTVPFVHAVGASLETRTQSAKNVR